MYRRFFLTTLSCLAAFSLVRADQAIESIQQQLKEEGFYYGEITGKKDVDTTAAIRRYQIRNGLQITGEMNAETQRSLGIADPPPSISPSQPTSTPLPNTPAFRRDTPTRRPAPVSPHPADADNPGEEPVYVPGPFAETPFEVAPPEVQRRAMIDAQTLLARRGFYRIEIDGIQGPEMDFALRAYQSSMGLPPNGRLDMETLASLGLLPNQRAPEFRPSRRRILPPRSRIGPTGERVYIPN